ncbi:aldo/keto reductase [Nocardia sp. NPDC051570]|uniref:aldo/keto reductase n=1 Tax=Nocardia sp. NPDC051570 TaxID=3364324 RepID=UPI00378C6F31
MKTDDLRFDRPGGIARLAGRPVGRIGFGAMQLVADRPERPAPDRSTAVTVLRRAVERGANHIDTAQFYGDGACNELIRAALSPYPEDLVLVSKVGAASAPKAGIVAAQRPEQLRAQVEANLATLGIEQIPVINLRRLDTPPGLRAEGDQQVDLDAQLAELLTLRAEGKIDGIGLSNVSAAQLRRALPARIECVQNLHHPLDRTAEPVLDLCREHDIAWVPFFPFGSAWSAGPKPIAHPTVVAIAETLNATPAQIISAWHLSHYSHTLLIPGTTDPDHLDDNLAAGRIVLDANAQAAIDNLAGDPTPE